MTCTRVAMVIWLVGWAIPEMIQVQLDKVTYLLCNELLLQSGQRERVSLGCYYELLVD